MSVTTKKDDPYPKVKQRRVLYDSKLAHGNTTGRGEAWMEVASAFMGEKWFSFSPIEKQAIVKEFEGKWKSLRDYFRKYVKNCEQAKLENKPLPKKYFYYEDLVFLLPFMGNRRSVTFPTRKDRDVDEDDTDDKDNENSNSSADMEMTELKAEKSEEEINDEEAHLLSYQNDPIRIAPKNSGFQYVQVPSTSHTTGDKVVIGKETADQKIASVLEELAKFQREEINDDSMGNKKFLLSLWPFMKSLPDDVNLEVRLQLMNVIQTYIPKNQ